MEESIKEPSWLRINYCPIDTETCYSGIAASTIINTLQPNENMLLSKSAVEDYCMQHMGTPPVPDGKTGIVVNSMIFHIDFTTENIVIRLVHKKIETSVLLFLDYTSNYSNQASCVYNIIYALLKYTVDNQLTKE